MAVTRRAQPSLVNHRVAEKSELERRYVRNERAILGIASFLGFFALWEVLGDLGWIPVIFFSTPSRIVAEASREFQTFEFWNDVRISIVELLAGWYRRLNYLLDPWLNFMYALPRIALLPLIVLWLGLTMWSVVMAVFLGTFFTVVINTLTGVHTVDQRLLEVATSFRASRPRIFRTVVLPGTLPFILA